MKPGYVLSSEAISNIDEICSFIADDNEGAAVRVFAAFEHAFELLAERPGVGHTRDDLTERPVKFWPVYSYLIVYDPANTPTRIIAVLHGARDVEKLLREMPAVEE